MKQFLVFAFVLSAFCMACRAATQVELTDCRLTPEVMKELQLTADQAPKVEKAFAQVSSIRDEIAKNRAKRDELRKAGADSKAVGQLTKQIVAGENQCRDQVHQELKAVLTQAQFNTMQEMEDNHKKKVQQ